MPITDSDKIKGDLQLEDIYKIIKSLDNVIEDAKKITPLKDIYETRRENAKGLIYKIEEIGLDVCDFVREKSGVLKNCMN